jgi:superoxide dismutase, Cu-Zn family
MRKLTMWMLVAAGLAGCGQEAPRTETTDTPAAAPGDAADLRVEMVDSAGRSIGWATLVQESEGVRVSVRVDGLRQGVYGLHIHESGRCDPPTFESAGGHFSPRGLAHGFEAEGGPHAGDLPNLVVEPNGRGEMTILNTRVSLRDGEAALLRPGGTAIVLHTEPDDHLTQPSGDSGDRQACGVIGPAG